MPELPEVETVVRGLQSELPGRRILEVRLGKTDFIVNPEALERELPGSRVAGVQRHGKFIVVELEKGGSRDGKFALLIHLGMTGQITVCPPEIAVRPHTHVFFSLGDGREFRYTDIRRFGSMQILQDGEREGVLGHLGLDPLQATEKEFVALVRARRARIKAVLLDQTVLRGIGNIYADESLWRARIHPMRMGANLREEEARRLYRAVQSILKEAIRLRGSSVSNYVDSQGQSGQFQLKHRAYQRHGKKCSRCGATIRRAIVAGRSSHFCPHCQPAPRTRARAGRSRPKKLKAKDRSR